MSTEIYLGIAGMQHMLKQPFDARYALFCYDAVQHTSDIECDATKRSGWLEDFSTYEEARAGGVKHPHAVYIRFFPIVDMEKPDNKFLEDWEKFPESHKIK